VRGVPIALTTLRNAANRQLDLFRGLSFTTISSTGPNAAIIHYSPDPKDCAVIDRKQVRRMLIAGSGSGMSPRRSTYATQGVSTPMALRTSRGHSCVQTIGARVTIADPSIALWKTDSRGEARLYARPQGPHCHRHGSISERDDGLSAGHLGEDSIVARRPRCA
jgi:hypothetical protein